MDVLKRVKGDVFTVPRDDGGPSVDWIFQRDASGRVTGLIVNGQFTARAGPLP